MRHQLFLIVVPRHRPATVALLSILLGLCVSELALAQSNLEKALRFRPSQPGVEIDIPAANQLDKCSIKPTDTRQSKPGWIVYDENGRVIRRFLDFNSDGNIDQLSYFRSGIEVYRDIDTDFDKKFDQMRWLGTGGIRWGLDQDQNGKIDSWKMISAEEVSLEVVEAIKAADAARFESLLITESEIDSLGMGETQKREVLQRSSEARKSFERFARAQKLIDSGSEWVHFAGVRPGVIPAGTAGSGNDIVIYDSVTAVVDSRQGQPGQLSIGTLIQVGDAWRVVDLPEPIEEGRAIANGGLFYQTLADADAASVAGVDTASAEEQQLFEEYEKLDQSIQDASAAQLPDLHARRAALFMKMIEAADSPENRSNWIRQMADTVSGAYRNDEFPDGVKVLAQNISALKKLEADDSDIAYAEYRRISNLHSRQIEEARASELDDLQKQHMDTLREFVTSWPRAEPSAEAMLQIGLQEEFDGNIQESLDWYNKISSNFPDSVSARKARGATTRLKSEGQRIAFSGSMVNGKKFDLASRRGKVVLLQYWATWCEPCKDDLRLIKQAFEKYRERDFEVVSISLDNSVAELQAYLKKESLPWFHLYEEGGLDSPLAEQLGVSMVPTMILVGADGKVIDRNISASDLDKSLSKAFRK